MDQIDLIEAALDEKPGEFKILFKEMLDQRRDVILERVYEDYKKDLLGLSEGPEDPDEEDEETEDDEEEFSDEDLEEMVKSVSEQFRKDNPESKISEEDLQELSRKTLARYTIRASNSLATKKGEVERDRERHKNTTDHLATARSSISDRAARDHSWKLMQSLQKAHDAKDKKDTKKLYNRMDGIARATKRLAKEDIDQVKSVSEEDLQELSRRTLASYTRKAANSLATKNAEVDKDRERHRSTMDHLASVRSNNSDREAHDHGWKFQQSLQKAHDEKDKKATKKLYKRMDGIDRATRRLAKD